MCVCVPSTLILAPRMDLFSNDPNISDQIGKTTHNMLIHSQFVKLDYGTPIYSILNS